MYNLITLPIKEIDMSGFPTMSNIKYQPLEEISVGKEVVGLLIGSVSHQLLKVEEQDGKKVLVDSDGDVKSRDLKEPCLKIDNWW